MGIIIPGAPCREQGFFNPIGSMYGIFTYIYLHLAKMNGNVGKFISPMDPVRILSDACFQAVLLLLAN